jgi:hypothetical protein
MNSALKVPTEPLKLFGSVMRVIDFYFISSVFFFFF